MSSKNVELLNIHQHSKQFYLTLRNTSNYYILGSFERKKSLIKSHKIY